MGLKFYQFRLRLKNAFHIVNKSLNRPEMTSRNHPKWQALWFYQSVFIFSEFFTESWFSRNWIKAKFQTQGLSITLYKLTYNWLAHSFNELNCQQKIRAFTAFFAFFSQMEKTETLDKKGDIYPKQGPPKDTDILKGTHLGTIQVLEAFFGCPFAAH